MSTEKQYTEEEVRRREREAFVRGFDWSADWRAGEGSSSAFEEARKRYPIKKRVPRALRDDGGVYWRLDGERVEYSGRPDGPWGRCEATPTADRIRLWADLLIRPYDEVEE